MSWYVTTWLQCCASSNKNVQGAVMCGRGQETGRQRPALPGKQLVNSGGCSSRWLPTLTWTDQLLLRRQEQPSRTHIILERRLLLHAGDTASCRRGGRRSCWGGLAGVPGDDADAAGHKKTSHIHPVAPRSWCHSLAQHPVKKVRDTVARCQLEVMSLLMHADAYVAQMLAAKQYQQVKRKRSQEYARHMLVRV